MTISPIHVLQFICPTGFYGAEMWLLALAKNIERRYVNIQLAVTREPEQNNLEIIRRFRSLGINVYEIEMNGRFDFNAIKKLKQLIQRENIEIIHTHGYKSDIIGLLAAGFSGCSIVATPHGFGKEDDLKLKFFMGLGSFALRFCNKIVPLSRELEIELLRMGISRSKIKTVLNGVDLSEIKDERSASGNMDLSFHQDKKIAYVGRLEEGKNVDHIIEAFDRLYADYENVRLLIIGDGALREELEQAACSKASGRKIDFLGYRKDRLSILKECDLFTMASSKEGIPRCLMEAMAMGLPTAAYDIPGVANLIENGETGLVAELGNVDALSDCWKRLLFNRDLARNIAAKGRQYIVERYSAQRMAEDYLKLYYEIVAREIPATSEKRIRHA